MLLKLTLILFSLIFMFLPGKFVYSCIYKAVGDEAVIPFDGARLSAYNELRWTHNQMRVYFKKGSQVRLSELNVDEYGSLILENVQKDKSGEYKGIMYGADGKLIKETVQQLCVQEPVPEPTVLVECVEKGVNLTCSAVNNESMVVSWMKNGIKANVTLAVLHVSSSELKFGDNFSCTVSNRISQKSAKKFSQCALTKVEMKIFGKWSFIYAEFYGYESKKLFGLDLWLMLVILTGGGSFLILFIICLVCVCRSGRRNKRKAKEEEEYRLANLMPDQTNQPDEQYMQQTTSQRASKSQRPLPPLPIPHDPSYFGPT
ncbi:uncharacterized protein si:dkey-11f4.20 [Labeo rohita]|uniref:uncharacterized protein si:dkey-11f4.20 n=1 Tax=Labeo rohita TaxID=84645 RepID=UPI0021E2E659|nr:uncharacterized protein si:dkey-11f4.20 [Labeo rohita]